MLSTRGLLLHSWRPCAAHISRQRTESQLTYHHLSALTPSSTSNRLKPSTLQCVACKGRMREVGGSPAQGGAPAELAAKVMWDPEKGTGDAQKPLSCTLAAGRRPGSTCRGCMCPAACKQGGSAQGLHGDFGVLYHCTNLP